MKRTGYAVLLAIIVTTGPSLISFAGGLSTGPSISVQVAYADTEGRGNAVETCATCFPSPWCGSQGVQFIGSSTNYNGNSTDPANCHAGDWDTGAILVTNLGQTATTLTNLTVALPLPASGQIGTPSCVQPPRPVTFNLWFGQKYYFGNGSQPAYFGGPIVLAPGGEAIFAGTSSDGSYTCPTGNYPSSPPKATYDFDTSDANFLSGCTPSTDVASEPQILFTAAGYAPIEFSDAGHVIDTGGIDSGNCGPGSVDPQWGHESLGWRPISDTCGEACPTNQPLSTSATTPLTLSSSSQGSATNSQSSASTPSGQTATTSNPTTKPTGISSSSVYAAAFLVAVVVVVSVFVFRRKNASGSGRAQTG